MHRRTFAKSLLSAATATAIPVASIGNLSAKSDGISSGGKPFKLQFAPHEGHFSFSAGSNILDQIRYAYDLGFRAWEDNRMPKREPSEQKAIGDLLERLGMTMGTFVIFVDMKNPVLAGNRLDASTRKQDPQAVRELLSKTLTKGIEVAKRCRARHATFVPAATEPSLAPEYQTANVVENLKHCTALCEPHNLTLLLEPLNPISHPSMFLQRIAQAYQICKMVGSPSLKILDDLYHQQITEGNLINNLENAWDEIAYIQFGDVPSSKEPGTGEINYAHITKWLSKKDYKGIIGMEHGIQNKESEGEQDLVNAYRSIDA